MQKQEVSFADQVDSFFHRQDYIKSLKKERRILLRELATIGQSLLNKNNESKSYRVKLNNLESMDLEELAKLATGYKRLSRLFKKYYNQLVAIELELITLKSPNQ